MFNIQKNCEDSVYVSLNSGVESHEISVIEAEILLKEVMTDMDIADEIQAIDIVKSIYPDIKMRAIRQAFLNLQKNIEIAS